MKLFVEILVRSGIYVISAFVASIAVMFFQNPQQFELVSPLPPVLITVQLVLEYIPSAALFSMAFAGFYVASMSWKSKSKEELVNETPAC